MVRIVNIPDLHLYDENIESTRNYPEDCLRNFDNLIKIFHDYKIDIGVYGGDALHRKINRQDFLSKIIDRYEHMATNFDMYAIRGSHEYSSKEQFTTYDFLLARKMFKTAKYIDVGELVRVYMFDFVVSPERLLVSRPSNIKTAIGIYHNTIVEKNYSGEQLGPRITMEDVNVFDNIDVAIINHVHTPMGYGERIINGRPMYVVTPGSIGRTSYSDAHKRDKTTLPMLEINEETGEVIIDAIPFQLSPVEEHFDISKIVETKRKRASFDEFTSSIENTEIEFKSARDGISKLNIDDKIKQRCYAWLEGIGEVK